MVITVNLHTLLQNVTAEGRTSRVTLDLPAGTPVQSVLEQLNIALPLEDLLLAVNGKVVPPEYVLEEGDTLDCIPAISGG